MRADLDVPLLADTKRKEQWVVRDDFRLSRALPTIRHLIKNRAKLIIIGHLGRPKKWDQAYSLKPVAEALAADLQYKFLEIGRQVKKLPHYPLAHLFFFSADWRGAAHRPEAEALLNELNPGDVAILENLRFYAGENENEKSFSDDLASLAEVYVNDAFSSCSGERASTVGVAALLPHYAGLELEQEVSVLGSILRRPRHPYVVLAGGIKLGEKLSALSGLLERSDYVLIGGGLSTLFFAALDYQIGTSAIDLTKIAPAREIWRNFRDKLLLPVDVVVARSPQAVKTVRVSAPEAVGPGEMILDIGPRTIQRYSEILKTARTLVWSGPMGMFEVRQFSHGTKALGRLFASRSRGSAFGVAGGGNTLDAVRMIKMAEYIDFLSTGGSALLQFLAGRKLSGIEALRQ